MLGPKYNPPGNIKFKQAEAELKQKKRIFWAKNWEKIEYKDQKLTNLKKKKIFWVKIVEKM